MYSINSTVELGNKDNTAILNNYFEILNDRQRNLKIDEIRSDKFLGEFFSIAPAIPNFGFTKDDYWFKFSVHNHDNIATKWFMDIDFAHHDLIELYIYDKDKLVQFHKTGRLLPFSSRPYKNRNFVFPVQLPPQNSTYTYYIKIMGTGSKIIPASLHSFSSLHDENETEDVLLGLYYGFMLAMVVYNLLMFFSVKKITYLFYIFFLISINLLNASLHGLTYQFLWPDSIYWNYISIPFFIGMSCLSGNLFSYYFLKSDRKKGLNKYLLILKFLPLASLFIMFISLFIGRLFTRILVTDIGMVYSVSFTLFMGVISMDMLFVKKIRSFYFFVGWLILPIAGIIASLKVIGLFPYNFLSDNILPAGMLIQSLIFSFSLNENLLQYEREKRRAQQKSIINLRKADSLKNEFLAKTSHELKTPLHGILGVTESLIKQEAGNLSTSLLDGLSIVSTSARRLLFLINDILDFTRLNNQDLRLYKKTVSLQSSMNTVLPLIKESMANKNVKIINRVSGKLPYVIADENRIQQILINLLSNAVKFTSKGRIIIHAHPLNESTLAIHIKDTGIGIELRNQNKIFMEFEQIDTGLSKTYSGMGLGLSITRQIIELHSGKISVKSRLGAGSRFTFTLPISNDIIIEDNEILSDNMASVDPRKLSQSLHRYPAFVGNSKNPYIFIVDDEPINIQILTNILEKHNFGITVAISGKECLEKLSSAPRKPDLILLDVMMPEMSGFEVARKIRENHDLYELPIIMITALNDTKNIKLGFENGANDYVTKPFQMEELLSRMNALLKLKNILNYHHEFLEVQKDIEMAVKLQNSILPESVPNIAGLICDFSYIPMNKIGGDYYDYLKISDTKIGFIIADVSGHGMAAALVSSMVKILFTSLYQDVENPDILLKNLNHLLYKKIGNTFLTACFLYIDLAEKIVRYSNAGHPYMIYYSENENKIRKLETTGGAIGFMEELNIKGKTFNIFEGDRIILYTDGLTEGYEDHGFASGEDHLINLIQNSLALPAEKARELIIDDYFLTIKTPQDDITLVIIDIV